ncbi:hypothetical protein Leryth_007956, partial [Lithospermum erythrorhizon]
MAQAKGKMEGWLYLIRLNMIGFQYSRKRYFILDDHCLKSFRAIPISKAEEPLKSAIIDPSIRVTDNGRKAYHRKAFFIFTLHNTSDHKDQLKLGATSPEEAARWIQSLQDVALSPGKNLESPYKRKSQPFRLRVSRRAARESSIDWTSESAMHVDAMPSDVIAPSPWKIFGCQNGVRLFKESKDKDPNGKIWGDHPAIMAVGVVDGTSEAIFQTIMSLGPSRLEWDYCFYGGSIVEHLDGHTDIIHIQLYKHWLPWRLKRRDMLLRRYWRRENDGTYVILYHSVLHRKCPPRAGYVRACLKSGGYVVTPIKNSNRSVVKHMLAVDWKCWETSLHKASARKITIRALGKLSAMIELFRVKLGNYSSYEFPSGEVIRDIPMLQSSQSEINLKMIDERIEQSGDKLLNSEASSLSELHDAAEEFYDVPEPSDDDQSDKNWSLKGSPEMYHKDSGQKRRSSAANFVKKKIQDLTCVQKKGYMELNEGSWEDCVSRGYGATLPKDSTYNMPCSWAAGDPSLFLIRGDNYLKDHNKIKAKGTLTQLVAADWLRSDKREDDIGNRHGGLVQKYAAKGGPEFFFIINIQVPGSTTYNLALYYLLTKPLKQTPLLERFVNADDSFRNSRFKLIPYISKGSWIVKQSVGKKACLLGQALEVRYCRGKNYLECDVDVGSSTIAKGVVSLVLGYLSSLVIELAFLIQVI